MTTSYGQALAEARQQIAATRGMPEHGLLLEIRTAGPVRVYRGDGTLLLYAGDQVGDDWLPAVLDVQHATEIREFLDKWIAEH